MKILNTENQYYHLKRKGITVLPHKDKQRFKKYNYFQVVNAYKHIFIEKGYQIGNILNVIDTNDLNQSEALFFKNYFGISAGNKDEFKLLVSQKILQKYGVSSSKISLSQNVDKINKLKYQLHKYQNSATYDDFIRLYRFEHQLRAVLMKYVLIIEENIKNIFCRYLNENSKDAYFLMNINNYAIHKNTKKVTNTMKKVYDKFTIESKAVERKNKQKIVPPYWVIIPTFTLNELLTTIGNLNEEHRNGVMKELLIFFTKEFNDASVASENDIMKFKNILSDIGYFRNLLAHNEPISKYNVTDLLWSSTVNHKQPIKKREGENADQFRGRCISYLDNHFAFIDNTFHCNTMDAFGSDKKINLAYIMYVIGKVIKTFDVNSAYRDEIYKCYYDFHIIQGLRVNKSEITQDVLNQMKDLVISTQNELNSGTLSRLQENLNSDKTWKREVSQLLRSNEVNLRNINKITNILAEVEGGERKYRPFNFQRNYTKYTGVDLKFLENL